MNCKHVSALVTGLMAISYLAHAQTDTTNVTPSTAKIFGGHQQYRTWDVGINGGILSPFLPFGSNNYQNPDLTFGYGISVKKQLAHSFGLRLDILGYGSQVEGHNTAATPSTPGSFDTKIDYDATLSGVINVATVNYLHRSNAINFYLSAGAGFIGYVPKVYNTTNQTGTVIRTSSGPGNMLTQLSIPVGVGAKLKMSDRLALNLGYTGTFLDGDFFDGTQNLPNHHDKFSYGYAGLELSVGKQAKPNLDWANPVAMMYDEIDNPTLKQEIAALKARTSNVERAVEELKKDSDGDGVADQFDKCPNTPAGSVVDGSGCPIKLPAAIDTSYAIKSLPGATWSVGPDTGTGTISISEAKALEASAKFQADKDLALIKQYYIKNHDLKEFKGYVDAEKAKYGNNIFAIRDAREGVLNHLGIPLPY